MWRVIISVPLPQSPPPPTALTSESERHKTSCSQLSLSLLFHPHPRAHHQTNHLPRTPLSFLPLSVDVTAQLSGRDPLFHYSGLKPAFRCTWVMPDSGWSCQRERKKCSDTSTPHPRPADVIEEKWRKNGGKHNLHYPSLLIWQNNNCLQLERVSFCSRLCWKE